MSTTIENLMNGLLTSIHTSKDRRRAVEQIETARRNWICHLIQVMTRMCLTQGHNQLWSISNSRDILQLLVELEEVHQRDAVQADLKYLLTRELVALRTQLNNLLNLTNEPEQQKKQCENLRDCYL